MRGAAPALRLKIELRRSGNAALSILHRHAQFIFARLKVIQRQRASVLYAALLVRRRKLGRNLTQVAAILNHLDGQLQLLRRALGGPGREEEGELFGDRLAQRLAQVRIDDDFAEMERVILLLLVGGEAVGSLEPRQAAQAQPPFIKAPELQS